MALEQVLRVLEPRGRAAPPRPRRSAPRRGRARPRRPSAVADAGELGRRAGRRRGDAAAEADAEAASTSSRRRRGRRRARAADADGGRAEPSPRPSPSRARARPIRAALDRDLPDDLGVDALERAAEDALAAGDPAERCDGSSPRRRAPPGGRSSRPSMPATSRWRSPPPTSTSTSCSSSSTRSAAGAARRSRSWSCSAGSPRCDDAAPRSRRRATGQLASWPAALRLIAPSHERRGGRPGPDATLGEDAPVRRVAGRADQADDADRYRDHRAPHLLALQPDPGHARRQPRHRRHRSCSRCTRRPSSSGSSC